MTMDKQKTGEVPKAIRWSTLLLICVVAVVAIAAGAMFAGAIRSGFSAVTSWATTRVADSATSQPTSQPTTLPDVAHSDHEGEIIPVTDESGQLQYYTCGMHPWVILPEPGTCPICHMDLTPIDPNKFTGEISIDPVVVQNMGVRVAKVVSGPLTRTVRTVGTIEYNEREIRDVNIKTPGWIEQLHVDFVGATVKKGEPLFELYSPDLYAAQQEYLLALRNKTTGSDGLLGGSNEGAHGLIEAARTRLTYFDITDDQIEQLEARGTPTKTMTIRSPHAGVVIAKHATEGMRLDPGMQVYRIVDLSTVWVMATVYEYQLPFIEEGMNVTMTLPYLPGESFIGEVLYIYPYMESRSREVKVRLAFENPDFKLKPGMFASLTLENTIAQDRTLVPRAAIIDTGERQVAFVSLGEGRFEPREVNMGVQSRDGMVEVRSGLEVGEMVVTSGQFLIDSESKMREALAKMIKGDLASEQQPAASDADDSELNSLPESTSLALEAAIDAYMAIGEQLAADTTSEIAPHAMRLQEALASLDDTPIPGNAHFWHELDGLQSSIDQSGALAKASDVANARQNYALLSVAMEAVLKKTGIPPRIDNAVDRLVCGIFDGPQKGLWLQPANASIRNPYMGTAMLQCNTPSERQRLPITGGASSPVNDLTSPTSQPEDGPQASGAKSAAPADAPGGLTSDYPIDFCLVSGAALGSMGPPVAVEYKGRTLQFCCDQCISTFRENPDSYLKKLDEAAKTLGRTHGGH